MFAPGDIVECVDASRMLDFHTHLPTTKRCPLRRGRLYTVAAFFPKGEVSPCGDFIYNADVLTVQEVCNPDVAKWGYDTGFGAHRFRHVYRPDPKLIERLASAPTDLVAA